MRIEDIQPGSSLTGLEPSTVATVIAVVPIADGAVQVIYKTTDGTLRFVCWAGPKKAVLPLLPRNGHGPSMVMPKPSGLP